MSKILLKRAQIFDSQSKFHLKRKDILIENGSIVKIANSITAPKKCKTISSPHLCVSPGWIDIGTFNGEPGFEYREDLHSLSNASVSGGYTAIAPFPTCSPTIDQIGQLHFVKSKSSHELVDVLAVASLSKNTAGIELSDLIDLHHHGAIAFSDGQHHSMSMDQLLRSLLYSKSFNGLVIYCPQNIQNHAVHEGRVSVSLGISGNAKHQEDSRISEAIAQNEYAQSKMLVHNISTAGIFKNGKSWKSNNVSFSVAFMNLIFTDTDLLEFDLNLKVIPPVRDEGERKALCRAVEKGQVNIITSNHYPLSQEEKDQPFGMSMPGAATIENVFAAMNTLCKDISLDRLVHCLAEGPRRVLGLNKVVVDKGVEAHLTIFDPTLDIEVKASETYSKSDNNPFLNASLKGQVIGIVKGKINTL